MKRYTVKIIVLTLLLSSIALQASDPNKPAEGTQPEKIIGLQDNNSGECNVPSSNTGFKAVVAGDVHNLAIKQDGSILAWGNNNSGERNVPPPNTGFKAIAAGKEHSLAIKQDSSIVAWGRNSSGECNIPAPNTGFAAVAAGYLHSLGLKQDGSIAAWGNNDYGECNVPLPNTGFKAVAAGYLHSLGLKEDGSIVTWGDNSYGQCDVPSPNTGFVAVAAGGGHSLGLKTDGSIVAWGNNDYGQCNVPPLNTGFVTIAAGKGHSLAIKQDGSIVAWGNNNYGECNVPLPNTGFVAVAAGKGHSLGLKTDGSIVAWGWNDFGQCTVPSPSRRSYTLEERIRQFESQRMEPNLPEDNNNDALRFPRLRDKIQKMEDAIELAEKRIENLPPIPTRFIGDPPLREVIHTHTRTNKRFGTSKTITRIYEELDPNYVPMRHCDYRLHRDEVPQIIEALKIAHEKQQLFFEQGSNYEKIIHFAERYSDLGVDVMNMKEELIECQGRKRKTEQDLKCMQAVVRANRGLFGGATLPG